MKNTKFNAAGFLDHHWFQNGLHTIKGHFPDVKHLANTVFDSRLVLKRIAEFHQSGKLNEALADVPDDIMLFLSRYSFPAEQLVVKLKKEDFLNYYQSAFDHLDGLMEKYSAD